MANDHDAHAEALALQAEGWIPVPLDRTTHVPRVRLDVLFYARQRGKPIERADYYDAVVGVLVEDDCYVVLGEGDSVAERVENGHQFLAGKCVKCHDPIATEDPQVEL